MIQKAGFVRKMRFAYGQIIKNWLFVRKQGLPGRGKLAFGRPMLAYGLMNVRLHTLHIIQIFPELRHIFQIACRNLFDDRVPF